ncbi:phage tail protein, partial [Escherichia coli]|nr:phage tail protein [Escherichia coli]
MLKTNSLRESMLHGCRWCQANPEKFTIFVE